MTITECQSATLSRLVTLNDRLYRVVPTCMGTLSDWLDFDTLMYVCERCPHVRWQPPGPATVAIPIHPRIRHHGVQAGDELPSSLTFLDGFVMRFRLRPLIQALDQVKIYEYLSWSRLTISIYNPAFEQFRRLVDFYRDADELVECIARLEGGRDAPPRQVVEEFLPAATWTRRSTDMARAIVRGAP